LLWNPSLAAGFQSPGAFDIVWKPHSDILARGADVARLRDCAALQPSEQSASMHADLARNLKS
jgi:hypothetical protein